MGDQKLESPDGLELRAKPKISARLNKKAVIAGVTALVGVVFFVIANVSKGPPDPTKNVKVAVAEKNEAATNTAKDLTKNIPDKPLLLLPSEAPILPGKDGIAPKDGGGPIVPGISPNGSEGGSPSQGSNAPEGAVVGSPPPGGAPALLPGNSSMPPLAAVHTDPPVSELVQRAMNADTTYTKFTEEMNIVQGGKGGAAGAPAPGAPTSQPAPTGEQGSKGSFLDQNRTAKGPAYEIVALNPPINDFEIKTGTVIPGMLISFINSDLPGEIVGQVSQNVFDSSTGRYLLIPQGSRLFGKYDSSVTFGQERLLVVWNRLIFPNGSTMDLSGMAAHDTEGSAGYHDLVNNHYVRTFGAALLTSMFSAAFQLSQPQQAAATTINGVTTVPQQSNQQIAAAAVGQQLLQLGAQFANRNLQVQPTLEVRKGYQFLVMVNRDLVFPSTYQR